MDPVLALTEPRPTVQPGGEARVTLTVRNAGAEVEQYRFEVLGECSRWTDVVPRQVSVLPEEAREETVTVVFRPPPAPASVAGEVPFGVRCVSLESPQRCAVVEGDVTVGAVVGLRDRLDPVTPRARWTGRYRAVFDNTGSVPVTLKLSASDTKRALRFAVAPEELAVAPGRTATGYLLVKPRQPAMLGTVKQHPFTVEYEASDGVRRGQLAGVFEQRPILSKGLVALAVVLVALLGAGAVLLARRAGGPGGPEPIAGPPPPVALASVTRVTDASVQLVWQRSPYATGYVAQEVLADGSVGSSKQVDERDQSALTWTELAPGKHCFRVLAVGAAGRSTPSEPKCVELKAAPPSSPAGPSGAAGADAGAEPVKGAYVIYTPPTAIDDRTAQGVAEKLVAKLQALGVPARLVDSRESKRIADGTGGLWVVLQDGFPDFQAALAECNKRRSVAPDCFAVAP
ncbi:fibronectin type III domain-containing protein [Dactylosporangium sp. NPDC049525]|uniref:fibronectin type III domain-containing protein n=1 Tax=Dactylosporangium sp. NPDC049525 TaxID=3154730 RepID=UPI0034332CAA